jgi:hypothetical protein
MVGHVFYVLYRLAAGGFVSKDRAVDAYTLAKALRHHSLILHIKKLIFER